MSFQIPKTCTHCGEPMRLENLFVDDGCPCNGPRGCNFPPLPCAICDCADCVKPGHHIGSLWDSPYNFNMAARKFLDDHKLGQREPLHKDLVLLLRKFAGDV